MLVLPPTCTMSHRVLHTAAAHGQQSLATCSQSYLLETSHAPLLHTSLRNRPQSQPSMRHSCLLGGALQVQQAGPPAGAGDCNLASGGTGASPCPEATWDLMYRCPLLAGPGRSRPWHGHTPPARMQPRTVHACPTQRRSSVSLQPPCALGCRLQVPPAESSRCNLLPAVCRACLVNPSAPKCQHPPASYGAGAIAAIHRATAQCA